VIAIALLGVFVLGSLLTSLLVVPLWREDRERMDRRVNELLGLLEAKAAPAETYAMLAAHQEPEAGDWLHSPDGLISVEVNDG
jgi:hypothetical protein